MKQKYDYLIVGSGLFGSVFSHEAAKRGKRCLVIEKRAHIGGNIYCESVEDILVHTYGAHIFHTANKAVWDYVTALCEFRPFINSPIANYNGELYNLPFNMNTFHQLWGVTTPREAEEKIAAQRAKIMHTPQNLEEQAIQLVGTDIYEKLIKGYTEKQWGRDCKDLPSFIIRRLPVRMTYDNNYFNDPYQGIPVEGYTKLIECLLGQTEVVLHTDFLEQREAYESLADKVVYTGPIDAYFSYQFGHLSYRSLHFETQVLDEPNYQGVAVMNYTDRETPFTRIIEHKHFSASDAPKTIVTREYSKSWERGAEPYYPINDAENQAIYEKYRELASREQNVIFGGRLAEYQYYDMDKVIASALQTARKYLY